MRKLKSPVFGKIKCRVWFRKRSARKVGKAVTACRWTLLWRALLTNPRFPFQLVTFKSDFCLYFCPVELTLSLFSNHKIFKTLLNKRN